MDEPELPVPIPARILNELRAHARESDPEECCGLVFRDGPHRYGRAVRGHNVMTQRQAEDPRYFRGDNRTAYYMSEGDVVAAIREQEERGTAVTAVYHSHVGAGAYLSESDLSYARHPLFPFPCADHIVLSVLPDRVDSRIFLRRGDEFDERPLQEEM
jgi:adenylyltransferase/sulfurtransferase